MLNIMYTKLIINALFRENIVDINVYYIFIILVWEYT